MSHFAHVDENGIVTQVIVADQEFINGLEDADSWVQTSYNTLGGKHWEDDPSGGRRHSPNQAKALRKNYAGIGFKYDADRDAFIPPRPFTSWNMNEETCLWEPPVPMPVDDNVHYWDEENQQWVLVE